MVSSACRGTARLSVEPSKSQSLMDTHGRLFPPFGLILSSNCEFDGRWFIFSLIGSNCFIVTMLLSGFTSNRSVCSRRGGGAVCVCVCVCVFVYTCKWR